MPTKIKFKDLNHQADDLNILLPTITVRAKLAGTRAPARTHSCLVQYNYLPQLYITDSQLILTLSLNPRLLQEKKILRPYTSVTIGHKI